MRVVVSGSTGLIGCRLLPFLAARGHSVVRLVRGEARQEGQILWDPSSGTIPSDRMEGSDAVVHLAGENIAARRWTTAQKNRIRDSRVRGTQFLSEALARLVQPPRVLVCASAIGYYGDRGDELLDEDSPAGTGFLAQVCQEWEMATEAASKRGIRVVRLRLGVVLSPAGGALSKMLTPFKMGVGGVIGDGRQYMSWIALDDVVYAIDHLLGAGSVDGPVNGVGPCPATNREFTKALGKVLSRPVVFP